MLLYTCQAQLVNVRTVGGNIDLPEAGFEGLAQVCMYACVHVCKQGRNFWRVRSQK